MRDLPRLMPFNARLRYVPFVLAAALVTACGSTVSSTGAGGTSGAGSSVSGVDGPGTAGPTATSPARTNLGSAGGSTGGSIATGSTGGAATAPTDGSVPGGTSTSGGSTPITTKGITAKEVYVGLAYDVNAGGVNAAAGVGISSGDDKANTKAIIADINRHGGVAGRKLVPVYAKTDSLSTQTLDQQYAAVCQTLTQDSPKVFAYAGVTLDSFRACMTKANVPMLSDSLPDSGQATFATYPGFIELGFANVDRLAAYEATSLNEQNYFSPWNSTTGQPVPTGSAKVGILTYDDRVYSSAVDHYLVPALKKLGYTPQVVKVAKANTQSDYGAQAASVKSAELSFATNGVTHVIPFEENGSMSLFFLTNARTQGYYPRYGINTGSAFEALLESGNTAPSKKQMAGAVGFGWFPSVDLPAKYNPANGPYSNDNRRHCLKVMADNGIKFTSGNAESIALASCAELYLLKTALDKIPTQITTSSLISTIESLGASYQPAGSLGQEFRPGRHDPSNKAYHWRYFDDCGCFRYEGSLQTIP